MYLRFTRMTLLLSGSIGIIREGNKLCKRFYNYLYNYK